MIFIRKGKRLVSKQGQSQPHLHSEARVAQFITMIWSILEHENVKFMGTISITPVDTQGPKPRSSSLFQVFMRSDRGDVGRDGNRKNRSQ